jgi:hypothetical protein
MKLRQERA